MMLRYCNHFRYQPGTVEESGLGLGLAALDYAAMGYAVLPLVRGGKKPHRMLPAEGGVHHATTNYAQIASWWKLDPAANIGVACGQVSRLAVVDLDVKGGADGPGEFARAWPRLGQACALPGEVATPSGGRHLWMRAVPGVAIPERPGILPGVDIKGDGGLVVAPPSMKLVQPIRGSDGTGGGEPLPVPYAWVRYGCACRPLELERMFWQWIRTAAATGTPQPSGTGEGDVPDLDEALKNGFEVGQRNVKIYRLACRLYRRAGTGPDGSAEVWRQLEGVYLAGSTSGMTRSELSRIAESARTFVARAQAAEDEASQQLQERLRRR